jgi:hypothetical protein
MKPWNPKPAVVTAAAAAATSTQPKAAGRLPRVELAKEKGGPSNYVKAKFKEVVFSSIWPKDLLDLQVSADFVKKSIVETTNRRATAEGAGHSLYETWVPFSMQEVHKFIGLMFCKGISPKPRVGHWFMSTCQPL